jgi:DNA invertase Pin-like site-specific DNA recombinase
MASEIFKEITFTLPDKGKLKAARAIGRQCGVAWFQENRKTLPPGFPEELADWSGHCRHAWRSALVEAWHAARKEVENREKTALESGVLVGYARVSTQEQTPQLQLDALTGASCAKVFVEKASGALRERPELQAALDYMRTGDTLMVWKLDRLARSLKQLIETVEELERRKIGFRSLTEAIDTTTAGGKLVFHLFASLAEFERSIIRERTRAGLEAARAQGRKGGRPPALSEKEIQEARALLKDPQITVAQVAARLGVGPSTLYRHLPGGRTSITEDTP